MIALAKAIEELNVDIDTNILDSEKCVVAPNIGLSRNISVCPKHFDNEKPVVFNEATDLANHSEAGNPLDCEAVRDGDFEPEAGGSAEVV
jgi:hypothetical protein